MSIKKKETITNTLISLFQTKDPQSIEQALLLLEEVDKDGSIHDAIIATSTIHIETDNLRHTAIIEGPLAQHCNHSITVYHPVYDRYIREQYTFPELFYRVLAQSPGGKSAELRNAITHIYLKHTLSLPEPTEIFDLSILQYFPRLKWLKVEYKSRNTQVLEELSLEYLSMRRYGKTLPLPHTLKHLILVETPPPFDLSRTPHLVELELDYFATLHAQGFDKLHHLKHLRLHIPKKRSKEHCFKDLFVQNSTTLETVRLKGIDTFEQDYPMPHLRKLLILSENVVLQKIPNLEALSLFTQKYTVCTYPKLRSFDVLTYIDLLFLQASPMLHTLSITGNPNTTVSFPNLPNLKELYISGIEKLSFLPKLENLTTLKIHSRVYKNTIPEHLRHCIKQ